MGSSEQTATEENNVRRQSLRPIARRALATQSDERLVGLVRDGHEPAFEEIVRRYREPLVAFATAIVSHHRAEDVVQASLAKAHRALLGEPKPIALRPWLFTIVRNSALNVIRDEPSTDELPADYPVTSSPASIAEQHEELDRLVLAICALPTSQREALVRRELEGAGHADIAAGLGTSATAVRGLIFRARTTLRDAVGALVPMPLLRQLLLDGSRTGTLAEATSTGAGVGAAVVGAAGAKGGVAVTAAVLALATGVAIERHGGDRGETAPAAHVRTTGATVGRQAGRAGDSSATAVAATTIGAADAGAALRAAQQSDGGGDERARFAPVGDDSGNAELEPTADAGSNSSEGSSVESSGSERTSGGSGHDEGEGGAPTRDDGDSSTTGSGSGSSGSGGEDHDGRTQPIAAPSLPPPPDDDSGDSGSGGGVTTTTDD